MTFHIRLASPPDLTVPLDDLLAAESGVTHVVVLPGSTRRGGSRSVTRAGATGPGGRPTTAPPIRLPKSWATYDAHGPGGEHLGHLDYAQVAHTRARVTTRASRQTNSADCATCRTGSE